MLITATIINVETRNNLAFKYFSFKKPLILPPDYDSLPEPKTVNSTDEQKKEMNIKEILEIKGETKNENSTTTSKNILLEESILKKIKNR